MKVFFDTNVYVAEALLGQAAEEILEATRRSSWRIYSSAVVLKEIEGVLGEKLGFSRRLVALTRVRTIRNSTIIEPGASRHIVPEDPADSPILQAAVAAGADYLVTNDSHLLALTPYQGMRILSMHQYHALLIDQGLLH